MPKKKPSRRAASAMPRCPVDGREGMTCPYRAKRAAQRGARRIRGGKR